MSEDSCSNKKSFSSTYATCGDTVIEETEDHSDSYSSDTTWPDFDIPGTWGTYGLEEKPWDEENKPVVRLKNFKDLVLNDQEKGGILSERVVTACSSYLDRCPETGKYVLCKCDLSQKDLIDISVLTYHHYLQYVDLSWNQLTDIDVLGQLPFLIYLDVSHNLLMDLLTFKPPFNLTFVNYSYNYVDTICDLSEFWSMVRLDLSHNQICKIQGLESLKYLRYLDLSFNAITNIQNLNHMRLMELNLENNEIDSFEKGDYGLKTLNDIISVNLANNRLNSLRLFEGVRSIQKIIMSSNKLDNLAQIAYLNNLTYLTEVNFEQNPITNMSKYYETCLSNIKSLFILDGNMVEAGEKILAKAKYEPTVRMQSANKHSKLLLLEQLNNFNISPVILPVTRPMSSMIVLVGPTGSCQGQLVREFYAKNEKYLKLGVSHTTRPKIASEVEGNAYYFVTDEKFKELLRKGEFVTVSETLGYSYGFSQNELCKIIDEKGILLFHTDLVGAITLRTKYRKPHFVLTLPSNDEKHYEFLLKRYCYDYWMSRNTNAIRLINNPEQAQLRIESPEFNIDGEIESLLSEVLSTVTEVAGESKPANVKFKESLSTISADSELSSVVVEKIPDQKAGILKHSSDEVISVTENAYSTEASKWHNVSFQPKATKNYHSISEVEFDHNPILSVVSEAQLRQGSDDSFNRKFKGRIQANVHIEKFINSIVSARKSLIDFHHSNPGFFCETLYADKLAESMNKLSGVLKSIVLSENNLTADYRYYKDKVFHDMISERLHCLHTEMHRSMYVSNNPKEVKKCPRMCTQSLYNTD